MRAAAERCAARTEEESSVSAIAASLSASKYCRWCCQHAARLQYSTAALAWSVLSMGWLSPVVSSLRPAVYAAAARS